MDLTFAKFVEWAFLGIISGSCAWGVVFLGRLNKSINLLNEKLAVVIAQQGWHQSELEKHEHRIQRLEGVTKRGH